MGRDLSSQVGLSLALMTDGLYVVAVRIAHEGSEVVRVVLGPQARLVKYLSTAGDRGIEKRTYRRAIGCGERDMRFAEALSGDQVANPEFGLRWWSVADCRSEVRDPLATQRSQYFVVEARAGTQSAHWIERWSSTPQSSCTNNAGATASSDSPGSRDFLAFSLAIRLDQAFTLVLSERAGIDCRFGLGQGYGDGPCCCYRIGWFW